MKVELSRQAETEIQSAFAFLSRTNPRAADAIQLAIEVAIESLADFPNRGRRGRTSETRELVVRGAPYVIVYSVGEDLIFVARIRHTRQDPSP